jgi:hypothetical protein
MPHPLFFGHDTHWVLIGYQGERGQFGVNFMLIMLSTTIFTRIKPTLNSHSHGLYVDEALSFILHIVW